jgi:ABC-type Fe3+/spermidine/putrescine transport system ATPase subunit
MTTITITHLTKHYPRQPRPALQAASLTIESGEALALLGPSGGGKSTLLKLVAGIERPDAGDVLFNGRSVLHVAPERRGAVLMFQKAYLFPFLSVSDNIAFGLKLRGVGARAIAAEVGRMLELVELPGVERKRPHQLSGGEQQRIALARALVVKPQVLLLDEPLSSLDTTVRLTLQEAIRRIQRELAITCILVTHDLAEAVAMSDRTALLLGGTIEASGSPEQLFRRPPTRAAAAFVGVSTFLSGEVRAGCLHTSLGMLEVQQHGAARRATFAIRPEQTGLCAQPGPNRLTGVVADTLFRGEHVDYTIAVNDVVVRARRPADEGRYAPGQTVYVELPPAQLFEVDD